MKYILIHDNKWIFLINNYNNTKCIISKREYLMIHDWCINNNNNYINCTTQYINDKFIYFDEYGIEIAKIPNYVKLYIINKYETNKMLLKKFIDLEKKKNILYLTQFDNKSELINKIIIFYENNFIIKINGIIDKIINNTNYDKCLNYFEKYCNNNCEYLKDNNINSLEKTIHLNVFHQKNNIYDFNSCNGDINYCNYALALKKSLNDFKFDENINNNNDNNIDDLITITDL